MGVLKPLIEISIEHYERLLKYASETSPAYSRLKNAVKTEANTIAILCDLDEAEMLRKVAKHFCPEAVPQIEKAIRLAVSGHGELLEATTPEQIKQKMDELAKQYVKTHDSEIIKILDSLALDLGKMGKLKT